MKNADLSNSVIFPKGDVVRIPANIKHWHGVAKDNWFVHLSIKTNAQAGPAQWLEPVSDGEYDRLQ